MSADHPSPRGLEHRPGGPDHLGAGESDAPEASVEAEDGGRALHRTEVADRLEEIRSGHRKALITIPGLAALSAWVGSLSSPQEAILAFVATMGVLGFFTWRGWRATEAERRDLEARLTELDEGAS